MHRHDTYASAANEVGWIMRRIAPSLRLGDSHNLADGVGGNDASDGFAVVGRVARTGLRHVRARPTAHGPEDCVR